MAITDFLERISPQVGYRPNQPFTMDGFEQLPLDQKMAKLAEIKTKAQSFTNQNFSRGSAQGGYADNPYPSGDMASVGQGQAMPPPDMQRELQLPMQGKKDSGIRSFLGNLGDALLIGSGANPIYKPSVEKREMGEAVAQYLGNISPELADIARRDPAMGVNFLNMMREDKRFDRSAGQDDRRIDISEGQLGLGRDELGERVRSNKAGEFLTGQGQQLTAATQLQLQNLRAQEAAAGRGFDAAMAANDHARAKELLGLQQGFQLQIAQMSGGRDGGYETVTETVEDPGTPAVNGWFSDTPATPAKKTTTTRKVPVANAGAGGKSVSKAQVQELATARGMSYAQAEQTARSNGFTVK